MEVNTIDVFTDDDSIDNFLKRSDNQIQNFNSILNQSPVHKTPGCNDHMVVMIISIVTNNTFASSNTETNSVL